MKLGSFVLLIISFVIVSNNVYAHPGSGIVVDRQGNVYIIDTGAGVWKIDTSGNLTRLQGPAYHWMAIDLDNKLKDVRLPYFSSGDATIAKVGANPTILVSSDLPINVGSDGSLYYPWRDEQLKIYRFTPSGPTTVVKTLPATTSSGQLRWLNGITTTPDGSVYYTENKAIRKITPKGELVTVADSVMLSGCGGIPDIEQDSGPYFRGLDVDAEGTVYVAASGCRSVVKITKDKKVTTVLQSSGQWSPTAVAVSGKDVYVLEYFHTGGENRREWLPRVKKVAQDGTVTTITTIKR